MRAAAAMALLILACGCSREVTPCSADDLAHGPLAVLVAECAARRAAACPDAGPAETCAVVDTDCDGQIHDRCSGDAP